MVKRYVTALFAGMIAASACAQSAPQPLNLKVPPERMSTASANAAPAHSNNDSSTAATSTATDASNNPATPVQMQPGVNYDEADGRLEYAEGSAKPKCDDATYNQPQVHGDMTVGVVGGNHVSGNYQSGVVNVSKAFGSCDHPTGGASISISVGQGNFNTSRRQRRQGW
jgi:hypothetical protein